MPAPALAAIAASAKEARSKDIKAILHVIIFAFDERLFQIVGRKIIRKVSLDEIFVVHCRVVYRKCEGLRKSRRKRAGVNHPSRLERL